MGDVVEVVVGVVGRVHGVRGEVYVEVRTDEPVRRFATASVLRTDAGRSLVVSGARNVSGRFVVSFEQVSDRTAAEQLRGAELFAQVAADESPSGADEYFDRQLVGLSVLDAQGVRVGAISAVVHGPAQDLLVVDVNGDARLVPFVQELVPVIDLEAGHVRLAAVGGLIDDGAEDA